MSPGPQSCQRGAKENAQTVDSKFIGCSVEVQDRGADGRTGTHTHARTDARMPTRRPTPLHHACNKKKYGPSSQTPPAALVERSWRNRLTCTCLCFRTGRIGSRRQLAEKLYGWYPWGVLEVPGILWGPSTPNPTLVAGKTRTSKSWPIFPICMWCEQHGSPRTGGTGASPRDH